LAVISSAQSEQLQIASADPVLDKELMNINADCFKECRITPDGRISVIDAISMFREISNIAASECWREIQKRVNPDHFGNTFSGGKSPDHSGHTGKFRFEGFNQRTTQVRTFKDMLQILSQLPGPKAKDLRAQQANLSARLMAGDRDLEDALAIQRAKLPVEFRAVLMNGLTSSVKTAGAMEQERRPQLEWEVTHQPQQHKRQKHERLRENQDVQYRSWHKDAQERRWKTHMEMSKMMEEDEDFNESDRVYAAELKRQISRKRNLAISESSKEMSGNGS
jgi:hypothetical protein